MKTLQNKRHLFANAIAVTLVLFVTAFMFIYFISTDKTIAATDGKIEIRVSKVTTVSIYAFGSGVELVESNNDYDLYTAYVNSNVRLQAVNETRIFEKWVISKTNSEQQGAIPTIDEDSAIVNFDVTNDMSDLTITVNRRNATTSDYGKYMMDRFVIVDELDLLALQNILAGSYDDADFALYYDDPTSYATNNAKDILREEMRFGYYLISNNFTVFNENFTGIGTKDKPFEGIMCGKNTTNARIFITITSTEQNGESSYGLFKYLGRQALIRNLNVTTFIGISKSDTANASTIYAGGLAGVMNKSTLLNVEVSTSLGIESNSATEIYAGGFFGKMESGSGIDSISDVVYNGANSKWSITSHKTDSKVHSAFLAGNATDSYIKEFDAIVSNQIVDLKNDSITNSYSNSKLYLGNIFGSYNASTINTVIDDIMIMGDNYEELRAITTNGDAMIGGLIGYVDANANASLSVERIFFRVIGGQSLYNASSIETSNVTNLYSGGLVGYVNGNNFKATNIFKNRLETFDDLTVANYIFEGDYKITSVQNGKTTATTNGKSISGGFIGKGLIDLEGTDDLNRSEIAIASPTSNLTVEAVQSKLTAYGGSTDSNKINDKEHASAALIYGSVQSTSVNISNINVYTNNTTIKTIREIGTNAVGDLHTGGFIGYANASTFSNIGLYFNNSLIKTESLSYEGRNTATDTNSAFCGGFAGELYGNSRLSNIMFASYDETDFKIIGTTSNLESIQNTIPGGGDYKGENYIGGMVGRIKHTVIENCTFKGSETTKNFIKMSGHESPDSAFCGGIVGLIQKNSQNSDSNIINCEVSNTDISGNATCIDLGIGNPDIYIGGIVGAAYMHGTNNKVTISDCRLYYSTVYALGNEVIATYAGGIIAGATWESSLEISDCYVFECDIESITSTTIQDDNVIESSSAGIIALVGANTNITISNSVVIDTSIEANVQSTFTNISSYASGISGFTENGNVKPSINNCYTNATVKSSHQNNNATSRIYAVAYNANVNTTSKPVETTALVKTYKSFELNGYTFEVVSAQNGTYRIRKGNQYYRRSSNTALSTTNNAANATTFTMNNDYLVYNSRYIYFNGTTIRYGTTRYSFNNVDYYDEVLMDVSQNSTAGQTYYLNKNVKSHYDNYGTGLGTGPFNIPATGAVNPYENYNYLYGFDGTGQKLYIEILHSSAFIVNREEDKVISIENNIDSNETIALAHVWINAKDEGSMSVPNHEDKIASAKDGWFIFDYVLLYTGELASISSDISSLNTKYVDSKNEYQYKYDEETQKHYLVNTNNASDIILDNYIEHGKKEDYMEYTFKVYDDMLTFNANLHLTHYGASYKVVIVDLNNNVIEDSEFKNLYGNISLKLLEKHAVDNNDSYLLTYDINEHIEQDCSFYIRFVGGNNAIQSETSFKINLVSNKLDLVGVTYADYTPPINYYETNKPLGTSGYPYHLDVDSITKFIPIFKKSNDLDKNKVYISEDYIEKCDYSIDSNTNLYFDIHSSGELITGNSSNQDGILNVAYDGKTISVYIRSVNQINVSYAIVGADVEGLTKASDSTNFYFEQYIRSNYGATPDSLIIRIGNNTYDLTTNPQKEDFIKIYEINKDGSINQTPISAYDIDIHGYLIEISNSKLMNISNISVEIDYPIVYTITFHLQCEAFNQSIPLDQLSKSYKIKSGTSFKAFFETIENEKTIKQEIIDWAENASIFGYVFTGFYLVNEASSIASYGVSFEDLTKSDYIVNASNVFYGRWSYLIELVEASGTHIKTGFNNAFLYEYEGAGFNRKIQIPINSNQGYVFRVDTDEHYLGTAGVEAYVVTLDSNGDKVLNPIEIEMYQDSNSLYYISPEKITGYLVVMTTVSNSDIIVGEHTSSVTEDIAPEDGIITFKYIVNHYNNGKDKSFIYNLDGNYDYKTLQKEFVLDFYKESDHSAVLLPDNTVVTVYYNRYDNGSDIPSAFYVGKYITHNDDRIYLTEFKTLDLETLAFPTTKTFGESLGDNKSVSEVYYFTITPPNGYTEKVNHEMVNYVVECGYVYKKVGYNEPVEYLKGKRNELELANPELNDLVSNSNSFETSKQYKYYHSTPSRTTLISKENDGTFTYTDDLTYSIYDIILTNTQKFSDFNYISLYDNVQQSLLETTKMSFPIKELRLSLGYRLGNVAIYGMRENSSIWEPVQTITVSSAVSKEYVIDFKDENGDYPYHAYMIDNISTNEIRVYQLDVISNTNGVLYQGLISDFEEKEVIDVQHVYSLSKQIVGDSRHDGKTFMLAIQLVDKTNPTNIIEDINGEVYIDINYIGLGIKHYVNLNEYSGKNVAYLNLSKIAEQLNVKSFNFNIVIPDEYQIYAVQLVEVSNEFKPASGEVRIEWPKVLEFAGKFMIDFNTTVNNNNTAIKHFYDTSLDNFKVILTNKEFLTKYKWFFEFVKSEINSKVTSDLMTSEIYNNTITLLNKIINNESINVNDYNSGINLIRYYIDVLINCRNQEYINNVLNYSNYIVDYSLNANMQRFMRIYENNKTK